MLSSLGGVFRQAPTSTNGSTNSSDKHQHRIIFGNTNGDVDEQGKATQGGALNHGYGKRNITVTFWVILMVMIVRRNKRRGSATTHLYKLSLKIIMKPDDCTHFSPLTKWARRT